MAMTSKWCLTITAKLLSCFKARILSLQNVVVFEYVFSCILLNCLLAVVKELDKFDGTLFLNYYYFCYYYT